MINVLMLQGKFGAGQMIENHLSPARIGRLARLARAAGRPTPRVARAAGAAGAAPRGAVRGLRLPPLGERPSDFLAEAPEAGR